MAVLDVDCDNVPRDAVGAEACRSLHPSALGELLCTGEDLGEFLRRGEDRAEAAFPLEVVLCCFHDIPFLAKFQIHGNAQSR
jgi:hypothetical protein